MITPERIRQSEYMYFAKFQSGARYSIQTPADYKSAIQQIENLRYECRPVIGWSHEYVSEIRKQATNVGRFDS